MKYHVVGLPFSFVFYETCLTLSLDKIFSLCTFSVDNFVELG